MQSVGVIAVLRRRQPALALRQKSRGAADTTSAAAATRADRHPSGVLAKPPQKSSAELLSCRGPQCCSQAFPRGGAGQGCVRGGAGRAQSGDTAAARGPRRWYGHTVEAAPLAWRSWSSFSSPTCTQRGHAAGWACQAAVHAGGGAGKREWRCGARAAAAAARLCCAARRLKRHPRELASLRTMWVGAGSTTGPSLRCRCCSSCKSGRGARSRGWCDGVMNGVDAGAAAGGPGAAASTAPGVKVCRKRAEVDASARPGRQRRRRRRRHRPCPAAHLLQRLLAPGRRLHAQKEGSVKGWRGVKSAPARGAPRRPRTRPRPLGCAAWPVGACRALKCGQPFFLGCCGAASAMAPCAVV